MAKIPANRAKPTPGLEPGTPSLRETAERPGLTTEDGRKRAFEPFSPTSGSRRRSATVGLVDALWTHANMAALTRTVRERVALTSTTPRSVCLRVSAVEESGFLHVLKIGFGPRGEPVAEGSTDIRDPGRDLTSSGLPQRGSRVDEDEAPGGSMPNDVNRSEEERALLRRNDSPDISPGDPQSSEEIHNRDSGPVDPKPQSRRPPESEHEEEERSEREPSTG
jgi:hypothetical protein